MSEQQFPESTVRLLIFNSMGEVILFKSHKWPDRYVLSGGHVELGESLEETAIREANEETGLNIYDLEFICFQQFIYDPSFWKPRHFIFFNFACKTDDSNVTLNDEAEEYVWINPREALNLPLDTYTRVSIEKYLDRE
jgi:nucleoside triphosphatase